MKKYLWIFAFVLFACSPFKNFPSAQATATKTATPSPTATSTPTAAPSSTPQIITATPTLSMPTPENVFYTVEPGDTLLSIAAKFSVSPDDLIALNHLADPDYIFAGQILLISGKPEDSTDGLPIPEITDGKQIVVVLHQQMTYAFEDGKLANQFLISSGLWPNLTVLGHYVIQTKYDKIRMTGDGYDLPNVPWTMFFYKGYSFHGTYWHHNFGHPMSHGCLNMRTEDAKWLYDWTPVGTPVLILP